MGVDTGEIIARDGRHLRGGWNRSRQIDAGVLTSPITRPARPMGRL